MESNVRETPAGIERNSKPYLLKRLISDGFDTVLIFGLFMLFTALLLRSPLAKTYQAHFERYKAIEAEAVEAYGDDTQAIADALEKETPTTILYTVSIPHLTLYKAEALIAQYSGSYMTEERG